MNPFATNLVSKVSLSSIGRSVALPFIVTALLYWLRSNEVTPFQFAVAFLLLLMPWHHYRRWRTSGRPTLPVFGMLAFMYWLYYVIPLFLEERVFSTIYEPIGHELSGDVISLAMGMCLLGVCALWLGMRSGLAGRVVPRIRLSVELTPTRISYVRAVLIGGSLLGLSDAAFIFVGEGGRQLIGIMVSVVPLLAFAMLFRNFIQGKSSALDRILIFGFLLVRFVGGLASGWLAGSAAMIVICGAIYLMERRRLPRWAVLSVIVFTLFFQVGKEDFRKAYWQGTGQGIREEQSGKVERVAFWAQSSLEKWNEALSDNSGESFRRALSPSVSRISLLNQSANVVEQTPSIVPYQYGWLYSYMAITFIPRFVWPDKPSMNEANQFYQVAYGLTDEDDVSKVAISVGLLTEGFINFGWAGVIGVMFLAGIFFDFYQKAFLSRTSGPLMTGIGVILLPQFLAVESQMAQYLGGIVQEVVVTFIVMLPILRVRGLRSRDMSGRQLKQILPRPTALAHKSLDA